ncbi:MAG: hypothetical protein Q9226_008341 [Calogaya cf. arnoldii]
MATTLGELYQFPDRFRLGALDAPSQAPTRVAMFRSGGTILVSDSLLVLLKYFRSTQCSEPRDKVYAVLGMPADLSYLCNIIPDYSKSLVDVYTDVVRFSLSQADHGLQVLSHVKHPALHCIGAHGVDLRSPGFPSWVPDYRIDNGSAPLQKSEADSTWAYNTCGAREAHNARIEGSHLIVKGFCADEIINVSKTWEYENFSTAEVQAWAPKDSDNVYSLMGQTRDEAFRRTVVADMDVWTKSRGYIVDWGLINAYHHTLTADESSHKGRMEVALRCASTTRRFCWTKAGRMGLAPNATQAGDLLFVLWGGQMMHVLRRKEAGTIYYVGESYVHGVMDGELVTDEIGDGQTIVLE